MCKCTSIEIMAVVMICVMWYSSTTYNVVIGCRSCSQYGDAMFVWDKRYDVILAGYAWCRKDSPRKDCRWNIGYHSEWILETMHHSLQSEYLNSHRVNKPYEFRILAEYEYFMVHFAKCDTNNQFKMVYKHPTYSTFEQPYERAKYKNCTMSKEWLEIETNDCEGLQLKSNLVQSDNIPCGIKIK